MVNIIGDLAGQYDIFLKLLKQMPDDEVVSVGDMIDRGPQSKQVVEWFMKNGKAILGNHEHMMIDYVESNNVEDPYYSPHYNSGVWFWNGGSTTFGSFDGQLEEATRWMKSLPLYIEYDGLFISHSFVSLHEGLKRATNLAVHSDHNILWNRSYPRRMEGKFQVAGHNSQIGLRTFSDSDGDFAICIDDSTKRKLTGLHWPSMKIYQQEYINETR